MEKGTLTLGRYVIVPVRGHAGARASRSLIGLGAVVSACAALETGGRIDWTSRTTGSLRPLRASGQADRLKTTLMYSRRAPRRAQVDRGA